MSADARTHKNRKYRMKSLLATLAVAFSGAGFAAPTTVYFAGTTTAYQSVDASTHSWVSSQAARRFSGSMTIDGSQGTLTAGRNMLRTENADRITDSRCAVASDGSCYDEPPAPSNVLAFSLMVEGASYVKWSLPLQDVVELSTVSKWRWANGSQYRAVVSSGKQQLLATSSGSERVRTASQSMGLVLAGDVQAIGDLLDLARLADLDRVDPAASVLRFSSSAYVCTYVQGVCEDLFHEAESVVFEGQLSYVGLAPQALGEVPEPQSAALLLAGLVGLAGLRRGQQRRRIARLH